LAKRLRGLEVDHRFVLDWCLHWHVCGLLALEDAVDIAGCTPILVDAIRPITNQTTGEDAEAVGVDGGQLVPGGELDDRLIITRGGRAPRRDQAVIQGARECSDSALDLARVAYIDRAYLHPERLRPGLPLTKIEPQRMSSLYLYFDAGGGGVGWRTAITGFGSTYVTSGEYQCSRLIETRIGIKRGV
jgi:hypothetical protein